jgi:hypothetical protein
MLSFLNTPGNKFLNKHESLYGYVEKYEKLQKCSSDLDCVFDTYAEKCIAISPKVDSDTCGPAPEGGRCICKQLK